MSASTCRPGVIVLRTTALIAALLLTFAGGRAASIAHAQTGCEELIVNGDFESGRTGWTAYSSAFFETIDPYYAHSPANSAWLVAVNDELGWITQTLSLPTGDRALKLSYWWALFTEENPGAAFDSLRVQLLRVDGTLLATLATYSNDSADAWVWNPVVLDLSAYAGQTVQLRFWARNDANNPSSFFIDDVGIESCPAGGTATPTATLTPGPSPTPTSTPRVRLYLPVVVR
jgi:hypothetical protein